MGFNSAFKGLIDNAEKNGITGDATADNMVLARCMLDN